MSQESENFQELMNLGHSAAWEKEWKKALEAYQAACKSLPLMPWPWAARVWPVSI
jgi:uncharacterized protein HemY